MELQWKDWQTGRLNEIVLDYIVERKTWDDFKVFLIKIFWDGLSYKENFFKEFFGYPLIEGPILGSL